MGKILKGALGLVGLGGTPKVGGTAVKDTEKDADALRAGRASLYETQGGILGQELNPDQVKKRDTIFGN